MPTHPASVCHARSQLALSRLALPWLLAAIAGFGGCATSTPPAPSTPAGVAANTQVRPPFRFTADDEAFLDAVQLGAFRFLWERADAATGLIPDRASNPAISSVAGVGFQLSALPIGVERGWITRAQGLARAQLIMRSLQADPAIRKAGFFQHFIDAPTAGIHQGTLEHVVSTIDSALLFCGVLTASSYFGADLAPQADALFAAADFHFFRSGAEAGNEWQRGFISLGWKPASLEDASGAGSLLPYSWVDSGCEHRLVAFLGVCAPDAAKRLEARDYYRLRRTLGSVEGSPTVWFPYSGALFVNQFSHCWINYAAMGPDDPSVAGFGPERRPRVDWWENSRRMTVLHQRKAIEYASRFRTLGVDAWGFSASDCPRGYCVPGVFPEPVAMPGATALTDYATERPKDDPGDGTVAPYAAGTSVMFDPVRSVAALRHLASIKNAQGKPAIWHDPATGGYGFADAINLDLGWASDDYVAIDQGPMLLAIENARSGLVWRLFHSHPYVKAGVQRLELPQP